MDIGYEGVPWTWISKWGSNNQIRERLDRGLCSLSWYQMMSNVKCSHVITEASDHAILLLDTFPVLPRSKKRFYFDKRWIKQDGFEETVERAWKEELEGSRMFRLTRKISKYRVAPLIWIKKTKSNDARKIKALKEKLKA